MVPSPHRALAKSALVEGTTTRVRRSGALVFDGGPAAARVASFVVDDASRFRIRHVADACAYEITYGLVELLSSPPAQLGIVVGSGNGEPVIARESAISLLGL